MHGQGAEPVHDPLEAVALVLEGGGERDEHEGAVTRRRRPRRRGPRRIVEDRADVPDVVGQRRREVERRRGEHEVSPGVVRLVEEVVDRREAEPGAQIVDPGHTLVPHAPGHAVHRAVPSPTHRPARRSGPDPERGHARGGEEVRVGHEHVERHAHRLGADHRPVGEERAHDELGMERFDRGADVGGVPLGRTDELLVEQQRHELERVRDLPVGEPVVLLPSTRLVGCGDPRPERRAGGLDVGAHRVLAEHRDVVAAVDEPAHRAELRGHGAAAVDQREQIRVARTIAHRRSSAERTGHEVDHDPLGLGAAQVQLAPEQLPRADVGRRVQCVHRPAGRGRAARQLGAEHLAQPLLVAGPRAVEQGHELGVALRCGHPPDVGVTHALVVADERVDGALGVAGDRRTGLVVARPRPSATAITTPIREPKWLRTVWWDTPDALAMLASVTSSNACSRNSVVAAARMRSRVSATPSARAPIA